MTSRTALFALMAMWGVGLTGALPARAEEAMEGAKAEAKADQDLCCDGLTNKVWVRTGDAGDSGMVRVFLSDGTLVQDSSWETHHLSRWQMQAADQLTWDENGKTVSARVTALTDDSLTLVLSRKGRELIEHYTASPTEA